ncbi:MAG: hypothetical protein V9G10_06320 [Candidatus Nanopelagicales bacterium]
MNQHHDRDVPSNGPGHERNAVLDVHDDVEIPKLTATQPSHRFRVDRQLRAAAHETHAVDHLPGGGTVVHRAEDGDVVSGGGQ